VSDEPGISEHAALNRRLWDEQTLEARQHVRSPVNAEEAR